MVFTGIICLTQIYCLLLLCDLMMPNRTLLSHRPTLVLVNPNLLINVTIQHYRHIIMPCKYIHNALYMHALSKVLANLILVKSEFNFDWKFILHDRNCPDERFSTILEIKFIHSNLHENT